MFFQKVAKTVRLKTKIIVERGLHSLHILLQYITSVFLHKNKHIPHVMHN